MAAQWQESKVQSAEIAALVIGTHDNGAADVAPDSYSYSERDSTAWTIGEGEGELETEPKRG